MIEERHCTYIWSTHDRRKAQHLYLINTWSKKGLALISDQHMIKERLCTYIHLGWNTSYHNDERACTHIWSSGNTSQQSYQNGPQSSTELPGNWPGASILLENASFPYICPTRQNGQHSHLTWEELNPLTMTEWFSPYIWSSGNTSLCHIRMASQS